MFKKVESILSRSRKVCTTIAITAGVGLGVYYGGKHVIKKLKEKMNPLHAVQTMLEEFEEENRMSSLFNATQDEMFPSTASAFIPILKSEIQKLLCTTKITDLLRSKETSAEDKRKYWDDLIVYSVSRVVSSIYLLTLLNLHIKLQITILSRNSCCEKKAFGSNEIISDEVRQTYIQTGLSHFLSHSVPEIIKEVNQCVRRAFSDYPSTKPISDSLMVRKIDEIRFSVEYNDGALRMYLPHIIPRTNLIENSDNLISENQQFMINGMLDELWDIMESPYVFDIFNKATDDSFMILFDDLTKIFPVASSTGATNSSNNTETIDNIASNSLATEKIPLAKVAARLRKISNSILSEEISSPYLLRVGQLNCLKDLCQAIFSIGKDGDGSDISSLLTSMIA